MFLGGGLLIDLRFDDWYSSSAVAAVACFAAWLLPVRVMEVASISTGDALAFG